MINTVRLVCSKLEIKKVPRCAYVLPAILFNLNVEKRQAQVAVKMTGHMGRPLCTEAVSRNLVIVEEADIIVRYTA